MKKVICPETKEVFESSVRASEWLDCTRQSVNNQLRGTAKSVCGYHFMYYDEYRLNHWKEAKLRPNMSCVSITGNIKVDEETRADLNLLFGGKND